MFHSGFIKDTEKVVLYIISERLDTNLILSRSRLKNFCVCFYHTTSFWGALNINYEINRAHLKMRGPFHSVTQFSSWFSKKKNHKVHLSSSLNMHALKVSRHKQNVFSP